MDKEEGEKEAESGDVWKEQRGEERSEITVSEAQSDDSVSFLIVRAERTLSLHHFRCF